LITDVLKSLPVKKVGYCGVMFPILEDHGLARYSGSSRFSLTQFLAYCSVCGVGIDIVTVANADLSSLESMIRDVAAMSVKLKKPLLVRILPIPDDVRTFSDPDVARVELANILSNRSEDH
jgi:uncharacterized protein (UPF0210 family)